MRYVHVKSAGYGTEAFKFLLMDILSSNQSGNQIHAPARQFFSLPVVQIKFCHFLTLTQINVVIHGGRIVGNLP